MYTMAICYINSYLKYAMVFIVCGTNGGEMFFLKIRVKELNGQIKRQFLINKNK